MSGIGKTIKSIGSTGQQNIDGLLSGRAWGDATVTFSFPTSNSEYSSGYYEGEPTNNFAAVTTQMQTAARFALDADSGTAASAGFAIESFTNLNLQYTTTTKAHLRLAQSDAPSTAWAYYPGRNYDEEGDIWFGRQYDYTDPQAGNYAWATMLHEIGHALGLKHSHETGAYGAVPGGMDAMEYTIMSYNSYAGTTATRYTNETYGFAQTYMMLDIAALQHMYGADYSANSGDTIYKWTPSSGDTLIDGDVAIDAGGNRIFATIWDGGGDDTYDLSAYTNDLRLDLRPGESSTFSLSQTAYLGNGNDAGGNIYNALQYQGDARSLIENAIGGSGNDTITGNAADNTLSGNGGNDTIKGGTGNDWLDGGTGADTLWGEAGDDIIVYDDGDDWTGSAVQGGAGFDTLWFEAVKVAIDLIAYGFEQAALHVVDAVSEIWSEITSYFNTADEQTSKEWLYDDGTSKLVVFDTDDSFDWSEWHRDYAADGTLTDERYFYDLPDNAINLTDSYSSQMSVTMSSVYAGMYGGDNLHDDSVDTFVHTRNGADEWVQVDLGGTFSITSVQLTNRSLAGERLDGAVVQLLDAGGAIVHSFDAIAGAENGEVLTFTLSSVVEAAAIRIDGADNKYLQIAELDVFGVPPAVTPINLTDTYGSQMSVTMSTVYSSAYSGDKLIDDSTGTFIHTANGADEWAQLDLGGEFQITSLRLINRDMAGERLNGTVVRLLDSDGGIVHSFDPITGAENSEVFTLTLSTAVTATAIYIDGADNQYLQVAELDVFGAPPPARPVNLTDSYSSQMSVTMSSLHNSAYGGDKLIDDSLDTFIHTRNGADEWVTLDFGGSFDITSLQITNRNVAGERLDGAVVQLLDVGGDVVHSFDPITGAENGEVLTFRLASAVEAAAIHIDGADNQYLQIAELDVFGMTV